ncbi:unnamed protein product [Dibothriocephalus latus]|uniref:Cadherin domain-containing protein n=1 Tax=Dibothriocephalus latus TaxID=60516 RepID=A0A3P7L1L1_DIBLA|nr:unnamed protein product [Dibothriocephalus latus]
MICHSMQFPLWFLGLLLLTFLLPPADCLVARFEINEEVPGDTLVGSLSSHLPPFSGNLVYIKVSNSKDASKYFLVDKYSGKITVAARLDRETLCTSLNRRQEENCELKFSVSCLAAAAADDDGRRATGSADVFAIVDVIVALRDTNDNGCLFIPTDTQTVTIREDADQTKEYHLFVNANDGYGNDRHSCRLAVNVEVEDVNDNLPVFEKAVYNVVVAENMPFDQTIVTVTAHDADAGEFGRVFYVLDPFLTDPNTLSFFRINEQTGDIFLKNRLNFRDASRYQMTVRAKNQLHSRAWTSNKNEPDSMQMGSTRSFLTTVIVTVTDVNDHAPRIHIFSPTGSEKLTLTEGRPSGRDVAVVSVSDDDAGRNAKVDCRLKDQSIRGALVLKPMEIEGIKEDLSSGRKYKILTVQSFDREQHLENEYLLEVYEDSQAMRSDSGFQIGSLRATDTDAGENAKLQYSFAPDCPLTFQELVKIDPETGALHSTGRLDREKYTLLKCKAIVTDSVFDADLDTNSRVELTVEHKKNTWPAHTDVESFFSSSAQATGSNTPLNVTNPSSQIPFLRLEVRPLRGRPSANYAANWTIPTSGGSLFGRGVIDTDNSTSPSAAIIRFKIRAQDYGSPRLAQRAAVYFAITDVNDNYPSFIFPPPNAVNITEVRLSIKEPVGFQFTKVSHMFINTYLSYEVAFKCFCESRNELGLAVTMGN